MTEDTFHIKSGLKIPPSITPAKLFTKESLCFNLLKHLRLRQQVLSKFLLAESDWEKIVMPSVIQYWEDSIKKNPDLTFGEIVKYFYQILPFANIIEQEKKIIKEHREDSKKIQEIIDYLINSKKIEKYLKGRNIVVFKNSNHIGFVFSQKLPSDLDKVRNIFKGEGVIEVFKTINYVTGNAFDRCVPFDFKIEDYVIILQDNIFVYDNMNLQLDFGVILSKSFYEEQDFDHLKKAIRQLSETNI